MISMQYEKPQLNILMFELEDILTASSVVNTTSAPTTLPGTTVPSGIDVTGNHGGDIVIDFGDYFK